MKKIHESNFGGWSAAFYIPTDDFHDSDNEESEKKAFDPIKILKIPKINMFFNQFSSMAFFCRIVYTKIYPYPLYNIKTIIA